MQRDERSLGELFSELSSETSTLVRQEIALARTEITQKAKMAAKDIAYIAAGGAIAYIGAIVLAFALVYALSELMWPWLAALIVAIVIVGVGYALVQKGISALKHANLKPQTTIQTLKEDKEWVKDQVK